MPTRFSGSILSLICFLFLISGCAHPRPSGKSLEELKSYAAERLFQDARESMVQGQYSQAARLFERFLVTYPSSPLHGQAHWWLAKTYHQKGELRLARQHYKQFLASEKGGPYRVQAKTQIKSLEQVLGYSEDKDPEVKGIVVSLKTVTQYGREGLILGTMSDSNRSVLIIRMGCRENPLAFPDSANGRQRQSQAIALKQTIAQVVRWSHKDNIQVYLGVNLRCLGKYQERDKWNDWYFDPERQSLQPSRYFDLFHPNYQTYLLNLLLDLAETKLNGFVFLAEHPMRAGEGFSPSATKKFEKVFRKPIDPEHVFSGRQHSEYWRWVGWKTRERLHVMTHLRARLKRKVPELEFGLEIHGRSVTHPVQALVELTEDWLEATRSDFEFFFVKHPEYRFDNTNETIDRVTNSHGNSPIIEEMITVLGAPKKIWVQIPDSGGHPRKTASHELKHRIL